MAVSTIPMNVKEIKVAEQTATIPANSSMVAVTANVPSGYKFLCWAQIISSGRVGLVYPSTPLSITSNMWKLENTSTSARTINCVYLYYK